MDSILYDKVIINLIVVKSMVLNGYFINWMI